MTSAVILSLAIATGAALAQTPPAAAPTTTTTSPMDKEAISKSCSDQANAQKLRGKERKKFRRECKRAARKAPN
jgi:hypothetical protein